MYILYNYFIYVLFNISQNYINLIMKKTSAIAILTSKFAHVNIIYHQLTDRVTGD